MACDVRIERSRQRLVATIVGSDYDFRDLAIALQAAVTHLPSGHAVMELEVEAARAFTSALAKAAEIPE